MIFWLLLSLLPKIINSFNNQNKGKSEFTIEAVSPSTDAEQHDGKKVVKDHGFI